MVISCQYCKQKVDENDVKKPFVFSLGDLVDGEFLEKEKHYYHVECLNNYKSYKRKKKIAIKA